MATGTSSQTAAAGDQADLVLSSQVRQTRTWRPNVGIALLRLLVVVILLGIWQLVSGRLIPDFAISKPTEVAHSLVTYLGSSGAWADIKITLIELLLGYIFGVLGGIAVGVALATWRIGARVFEPMITAINGIPKVALAPLFLIMLGLGIWSKVAIASMTVFFVMFYNMYYGVQNLNRNLINVIVLMGGSKLDVFRSVILPGSMPSIIAGLKAGVPFALIGVIVGEFIASDQGVGYYINTQTQQFNAGGTFAGILVLVIITLILNALVGVGERFALRWREP
jgi:ABC-type nitrate/sulfonate/bicarbonate transport system permease component